MLLRAGLISLALLLLSRVLGVGRESAVAAGFGVSAIADWVVLLVSLPDWLTGVFVGGALSYVLVPHWARAADAIEIAASQVKVMRALLVVSLVLAVAMALAHAPLAAALAPGAYPLAPILGWQAVWGVAASLPLALVAALWSTRLQYEQDFIGVYGANVVVNLGLIAAIVIIANCVQKAPTYELFSSKMIVWMALAAFMVMLARLAWLAWRMPAAMASVRAGSGLALPSVSTWVSAALAAGLPLALPFAARSVASVQGEGALALFGYAWKLVELPQVLLLQLVATLALPAISRAFARSTGAGLAWNEDARRAVSVALALAWALGCASAVGLVVARMAPAQVLFGWGAMQEANLVYLAANSAVGALALPALGVVAVSSAVLAAQNRLYWSALAHSVALWALLAYGAWGAGPMKGTAMMWALVWVSWALAVVLVLASGVLRAGASTWASMAASVGASVLCALIGWLLWTDSVVWSLALGGAAAALVALAGVAAHAPLRQMLLARLAKA